MRRNQIFARDFLLFSYTLATQAQHVGRDLTSLASLPLPPCTQTVV